MEPITMEEGRESETEIFLRMELDSSGLFTARSFLIMSIFAFNCASFLMISRFLVRSQGQKQSLVGFVDGVVWDSVDDFDVVDCSSEFVIDCEV